LDLEKLDVKTILRDQASLRLFTLSECKKIIAVVAKPKDQDKIEELRLYDISNAETPLFTTKEYPVAEIVQLYFQEIPFSLLIFLKNNTFEAVDLLKINRILGKSKLMPLDLKWLDEFAEDPHKILSKMDENESNETEAGSAKERNKKEEEDEINLKELKMELEFSKDTIFIIGGRHIPIFHYLSAIDSENLPLLLDSYMQYFNEENALKKDSFGFTALDYLAYSMHSISSNSPNKAVKHAMIDLLLERITPEMLSALTINQLSSITNQLLTLLSLNCSNLSSFLCKAILPAKRLVNCAPPISGSKRTD